MEDRMHRILRWFAINNWFVTIEGMRVLRTALCTTPPRYAKKRRVPGVSVPIKRKRANQCRRVDEYNRWI